MHTSNVFLEGSQTDEQHEGTSGKYNSAKVRRYVEGVKFKDQINISEFLPILLSAAGIYRSGLKP